ncbi:hypothetical protein ONS95_000505 [Cadophora gregata]|uniref:uncharacterized protein n=1 Tax=Cadophora gregata TaxID=51156 RepID=UPI0026DC5ACE|nr:uncharacterized protein ONS95_000505 [Cadophora gregata]KAK0128538.1 hypothetical protein ONS95_000505 [Cadophora gregata]
MEDLDEEVFYECLATPQTPTPTRTFHLPLSTLSIYCRQHDSSTTSNKTSELAQNGAKDIFSDSTTNKNFQAEKIAPILSSVVIEYSPPSHMTSIKEAATPHIPPSTPPSSYAQLSNPYEGHGFSGYVDSNTTSEAPPLSPSSSVSTTESISEPPTPGKDGSIRPRRFWSSPTPIPSPQTFSSNKLDILTSSESNLQHRGVTGQQIPASPTSVPESIRVNQRLVSKSTVSALVGRRKASRIVLATGPYIREGFKLVNWPEAHPVLETDALESGHVIGYGTYPVQLTFQQLARQKRNIMRRKVQHYRLDEEIKIVKSYGSVSGESETSSEGDKDSEKGTHIEVAVL